MSALRVLFVTAWYPSREHAANGVFVREHARAAARHAGVAVVHGTGLDPALRAPFAVEREDDAALHAGFPTWRVRHGRSGLPLSGLRNWLRSYEATLAEVRASGFAPDLIHAHVHPVAFPSAVLARRHGLPFVVTEHSSGFPRRLLSRREALEARWAFRRAARVLPVSRALRDGIVRYGIEARFTVVPNAVDTAAFRPPGPGEEHAGPLRLFTAALLQPVKGLDVLFRALARLAPAAGDWTLEVAGEGPEREALQGLARDLGIAPRVRLLGLLAKEGVAERMRGADLFVLPSRWENLPCALVEALATGLPVVATAVGGVPELIGPDEGELVPAEDPDALAAALARQMPRARGADRARRARSAAPYAIEAVGETLAAIYREVLEERAG